MIDGKFLDDLWDNTPAAPVVEEPTEGKENKGGEEVIEENDDDFFNITPTAQASKPKEEEPAEEPIEEPVKEPIVEQDPAPKPDDDTARRLKDYEESIKLLLEDFGVEMDEEAAVNPTTLYQTLKDEVPTMVREEVESLIEKSGNWGKAFLKHVQNAKTEEDVVSFFKEFAIKELFLDINDAASQEAFLTSYYKDEVGMDEEDAIDTVERLREGGQLETKAKLLYSKKREKQIEERRNEKLTTVSKTDENMAAEQKRLAEFKRSLMTIDEVGGNKLTELERLKLIKYGESENFKNNIKEITSDPSKYMLFLDLVQNGMNLDKYKVQGKKEVIKEIEKVSKTKKPKEENEGNFWDFTPQL